MKIVVFLIGVCIGGTLQCICKHEEPSTDDSHLKVFDALKPSNKYLPSFLEKTKTPPVNINKENINYGAESKHGFHKIYSPSMEKANKKKVGISLENAASKNLAYTREQKVSIIAPFTSTQKPFTTYRNYPTKSIYPYNSDASQTVLFSINNASQSFTTEAPLNCNTASKTDSNLYENSFLVNHQPAASGSIASYSHHGNDYIDNSKGYNYNSPSKKFPI